MTLLYRSAILKHTTILKASLCDTPLGQMLAIANEQALYLLEFSDCNKLEHKIKQLKLYTQAVITSGRTQPLELIKHELDLYFTNRLREFTTPVCFIGSPFQKSVWQELKKIAYGKTASYSDIASALSKPLAYRAVAQANSANHFVILVPCHRVINANGNLGGYSSGIPRKKWLINHENN